MTTKVKMTQGDYLKHCDDSDGLCLACTQITYGNTEPDATDYLCDHCSECEVVGMEIAMLNGDIELTDDDE